MSTTNKPHPHAEVIKAWADGKTIQFRLTKLTPLCDDPVGVWTDFTEPLQLPAVHWQNYEWRIKPEQKTRWINIYKDTFEAALIYPDKQSAKLNRDRDCIACIEITYTEGEGLE